MQKGNYKMHLYNGLEPMKHSKARHSSKISTKIEMDNNKHKEI